MNFKRLVFLLTIVAIFTMALRVSIDTDTWWHLRAGSWVAENKAILKTDPFSFTTGDEATWEYPGWLAQLTLYGVFEGIGFAGLNLFTALMVLLAFLFIWPTADGSPLLKSAVWILAVTASGVYWSARPQIISFALAGLYLFALEQARNGKLRWLWILPPGMALWVNIHGGFAIGFMLILVYLAGTIVAGALEILKKETAVLDAWSARRRFILGLIGVGLLSVIATFLNPHGPAVLAYPFKTVSIDLLQAYIQEWQSPDFHQLEAQPFLWMLFLSLGAFAGSRRPIEPTEFMLVGGFAYLSFLAGRNIALFALVAAPPLLRHLDSAIQPILPKRELGPKVPEHIARRLNLLILGLLLIPALVKISLPLSNDVIEEALEDRFPVHAVDFIQTEKPTGPLFNSYNWGGYILWELYPDYKTFVDGRTDLFGEVILSDYLRIYSGGTGWEQALNRWEIGSVMIEPQAPLVRLLELEGWERLYSDEKSVVFTKPIPGDGNVNP